MDRRELERLYRENPDDPHVALELGDALQAERRIDEALAIYDRVATQYERDAFHTKALAVLQGMAALAPMRIDIRVRLARVLETLGLRTDATAVLEQAKLHAMQYGSIADQEMVRAEINRLSPPN